MSRRKLIDLYLKFSYMTSFKRSLQTVLNKIFCYNSYFSKLTYQRSINIGLLKFCFTDPSLNCKFLFYSLPVSLPSLAQSIQLRIYFQEIKIAFNHSNRGDKYKSYNILHACQKQRLDQRNRQHLSGSSPQANAQLHQKCYS